MRIRVLGGGIYGSHIALEFLRAGHDVELHEIKDRLFAGASGAMPARAHLGFHYPRSAATRAACQRHTKLFEERYGHLTRGVPINIYAIAEHDSLLDFATYRQILKAEVECVTIDRPGEFGLTNVEGALLTGERHIVVRKAREFFTKELGSHVRFNQQPGTVDDARWDLTIDATFCANDSENIDRFEGCLTVLMEGPVGRAITTMDGPFPGIYVWDEEQGLTSLTSAEFTPMVRRQSWKEARQYLDWLSPRVIEEQTEKMVAQMAKYYPRVRDEYRVVGHLFAVRAMPRSAADARLVDVIWVGERAIRVRAGKLDAIFTAMDMIEGMLRDRGMPRLAA